MRIVSGGQSGVDRAALDVALESGVPCGGWCPHGRLATDGPIAQRYPLRETPSSDTAQRTEWNVRDSDATLIIAALPLHGGTALTHDFAQRLDRPCLVVDPGTDDTHPPQDTIATILAWIGELTPSTLNVAGPREDAGNTRYRRAANLLRPVLATLTHDER